MIAALDVGSVYEKEIDYGTQVTANEAGRESFFGNGTKNARTDFNISASDAAPKVSAVINRYLNMVPNVTSVASDAPDDNAASPASLADGFDALEVGLRIQEAKSIR
mmetsp:Transcript_891/g.1917  ORF Transcript_891/g.1917 Transcript_891/m.1917 type:complete len:107 (-) Transcript_891:159-479(-)|eukprot:4679501-Prymnesium_polylepis.1